MHCVVVSVCGKLRSVTWTVAHSLAGQSRLYCCCSAFNEWTWDGAMVRRLEWLMLHEMVQWYGGLGDWCTSLFHLFLPCLGTSDQTSYFSHFPFGHVTIFYSGIALCSTVDPQYQNHSEKGDLNGRVTWMAGWPYHWGWPYCWTTLCIID